MKVIFAGGGTLGSVSPLIAIWQALKNKDPNLEALFIGTKTGPEKFFLRQYANLLFTTIPAGKLRRYFSFKNLFTPALTLISFIISFLILTKFKPQVIVSAGSYVAVPLIWAARILKIKVILYQSDLIPGLANRLNQKQADYIFTAFNETTKHFPKNKTQVAGTVLRQEIKAVKSSFSDYRLLILGGGTGAQRINKLIKESLNYLQDFKIIHVTGKNKDLAIKSNNYQSFELLRNDYYQKMAEADIVISRAGLSTLMELSYLAKPAILIPLPATPQEQNADYFCLQQAALCLEQNNLTAETLRQTIADLKNQKLSLSQNIKQIFSHGGEQVIAQKIYELGSNK